jgi:hypothetical protein
MSTHPTNQTPPSEQLPREVVELITAATHLPAEFRPKIELLVHQVAECTRRRKRILSLVQDALGQLRLDMKYLIFDLEATRRERDTYLSQLERKQE